MNFHNLEVFLKFPFLYLPTSSFHKELLVVCLPFSFFSAQN